MNVWLVVIMLGVATIATKAAGPVLLGQRRPLEHAQRILVLLSPAVLAALVAVQVFTTDQELRLDARVIGLATAAVAALLRTPLLVLVICAVAATALSRAVAA